MKKKALVGGIAAALLGSGLLWYSGNGPDQGIAGWEILNDSMEKVVHAGKDNGQLKNSAGSVIANAEIPVTAEPLQSIGKSSISTGAIASSTDTGPVSPTTPPASASEGMVNVNMAAVGELMGLPGIGAAKAKAILDYRTNQGPFKSLSDLGKVKGIGPKMLEKLKPLVSF